MSEEDIEHAPRRRSARIIALGEKRERQKKALEEARKNCPDHQYKRKGKAVISGEQVHGFIDDEEDDDEYARTKKRGRKSRLLNQLISLTQPIQDGQYTEYSSASRRRYGLTRILPKDALEFVLDLLQRKDPDEFFAQPVNPDRFQDYYRIVKEPMDFGTMRAKVHENMYTNMEQFERDVYLICSNAMNVNPSSATSHKVAEAIKDEASKLFHALPADPEFFDMGYFGPDGKKSRGRKGHARSKISGRPRQLRSKPGGGNSGANNSMRAEVDKRQTYRPSGGDSIFSQVLDRPKTNLLLHKSSRHYQDSLVRFTEDLGPAVKKCAARKIESLRQGQIMGGQATILNPLANFLEPTSTLPPHAPHSRHYPVSSNRPLTIPGFTPHEETRNNINFGDYKGKKVVVDPKENWNAYAASILSGYFMNNNEEGRGRGLNFNGEGSSSNSNMPSSFHQNRSSFLTSPPSNQNQNQNQRMHRPQTSNARNNLVNTGRNHVAPREFTQVEPRVWPNIVIPGPNTQTRPNAQPIIHRPEARRRMLSDHSLSSRQNPMRPEQEPTLVGLNNNSNLNLSEHSRLPQNLTGLDFSLLRHALWSQQIPTEQVTTGNNFTSHPFMPDQNNKPAMFLNNENNNLPPSWKSFIIPQQQNPQKAVNMSSYNFSAGQQPLLSSQQSRPNSNPMNGYDNNPLSGNGQSVLSQQPGPEDLGLITGFQSFPPQSDLVTCQSFMPQQNGLMAQAVTGFNDNNLSQVAKWREEGASNLSNNMVNTLNQPDEFQTIWAPIDLNNIPLTEIYTAPPMLFDNSGNVPMQPEPEPDQAQLNGLGLFPRHIPTPVVPSSASLEIPAGLNAMNYYMGNAMVDQPLVAGGGEGTSTAQLQWNNGHYPNLALQL
ncbi:hypothetical protein K1719_010762 [Acacia pycnantha]|nr:hypothetical protein K1719_010762 [Acacia pycnantha]